MADKKLDPNRKPTQDEILLLTKLIDYATSAIKYGLTNYRCSENEPMYPVALSMVRFTIAELMEIQTVIQ